MKYKYNLPIFPEKGKIFLDTSSFGIDDYAGFFKDDRLYISISKLRAETLRLIDLKEKLLEKNNWIVIQEVLNEFLNGNLGLEKEVKHTRVNQRKSAFKKLLKQRENILKLILNRQIPTTQGFSIERRIGAD